MAYFDLVNLLIAIFLPKTFNICRRSGGQRIGNSLFCGIFHVSFIKMKVASQVEVEIETWIGR